jgi:predicted 3-demethylubiquinone-9 3-methyltransferase (glyoxalase superfamily)
MPQKVTPHFWYDKEAKDAANHYVSAFGGDSKVDNVHTIHDTPSGDCDIVAFTLAGQSFRAISAGPMFKLNPSISLLVKCNTKEEVDALWGKLSEGGSAMMELGSYPFSERYGWTADKYGLSWQIMFVGDKPVTQKITPFFMFVGRNHGKAEEAINFYTSIFSNSKIGAIQRYGQGEEPEKDGTIKLGNFTLEGQDFAVLESSHDHQFFFNEAFSLMVNCENQEEIDYFWGKMSAVPEAEQCGWIKDKYGVSWQIISCNVEVPPPKATCKYASAQQ